MSTPTSKRPYNLTDAAKGEMEGLATWLEMAPFDRRGDFEQCSDNAGLLQHASRFLQLFPLPVQ